MFVWLAGEELGKGAALVEGDACLSEGVEEVAVVAVDRSHDGEVDRVGLRAFVRPGAARAMAPDGVGAIRRLGAPAKNDSGAFQIGTRSTQTVLRLKDGETQVLGGLIQDGDRSSGSRIPGLGEVPLLTRLFGNDRSDKSKSELIVSITPRIIRPVSLSDPSQNNIWSTAFR